MKQAHPEASFSYELEGDLFYTRKEFEQAAAAYALASAKTASASLAEKLFRSRLKAGETDAAYQALLAHPLGPAADQIQTVLDDMLVTHRAHLPQFWQAE